MTHTPEPWQHNGSHIYGPDPARALIGQVITGEGRLGSDRNRIIACVNACAGIPDPAQLRADRDALLEACKLWLVYDEGEQSDGVELMLDYADALAATRAAVARIRGEG